MLLTEIKEGVGYIILNRIEKKNALNYEFISKIKACLTEFKLNSEVRVLIIKSNSDIFCAGADLEYLISLEDNSYEENIADTSHIAELFHMIYTFPKITIAEVSGHAIAGGCGIATACDFCYATDSAKFGYSEVKIGFVPALVSVYLIKKIGEAKARELLLTGKLISGNQAVSYGIINETIPSETLATYCFELAKNLASSTSPLSIQYTKELLINLYDKSWSESIQLATKYNAQMRETSDFKKGISSFVNKTKLSW